jgi:protocatechuate 3,4-dioxygenase beta subunit
MDRRKILKIGAGSIVALFGVNAIAGSAEVCVRSFTPKQPEGPFYPKIPQTDTNSDLIYVNGSNQVAQGQIILVEGVLTDQHCRPVAGALVEIWQACHSGRYNHDLDPNPAELDSNFQYWGKAVTDTDGLYRFRTILPGSYPAGNGWTRPPHIHFKVTKTGYLELITQMYFSGQALNKTDLILQRLSPRQQEQVVVELKTSENLPHPVGQFNIQIEKLI